MTKTVKKYKKACQMTAAEKAHRIERIRSQFYEMGCCASSLLQSELAQNNLLNDPKLASGVKQLQKLESQMVTLEQEYNVKFMNEVIPMTHGFEQEIARLEQKYEEERMVVLRTPGPLRVIQLAQLSQRKEEDVNKLRKNQATEKKTLEKQLRGDIDKCKKDTFAMFMRYIHRIYK